MDILPHLPIHLNRIPARQLAGFLLLAPFAHSRPNCFTKPKNKSERGASMSPNQLSTHPLQPDHHPRHLSPYRLLLPTALATILLTLLLLALPSHAQSPNTAHIIVQWDDYAHLARPITFTDPISGLLALQRSGIPVIITTTSFGPAVCAIAEVGCPASDCFCDDTRYWSYRTWDGAAWQEYPVGAAMSEISSTGALEGWRWGEFGSPQVAPTQTLAAQQARTWLQARQVITTGGYGSASASVETLLAVAANGEDAATWRSGSQQPSLAGYLRTQVTTYSRSNASAAGKLAVALAGGNLCLPIATLTPQDYYSPTLNAYSPQSGPNSWAMLGALALAQPVPDAAITTLAAQQLANGGWEWATGWGADSNSTALALQALIAAGQPISSSAIVNGLAYLATLQQPDGGFPYAASINPTTPATSDANSTAYVIQAIIAAGQDPASLAWTQSGNTPISYLLALQLPDGSLQWQAGSGPNQLATQQAIPALLGQSYPLRQRALAACPATWLPALQTGTPAQ